MGETERVTPRIRFPFRRCSFTLRSTLSQRAVIVKDVLDHRQAAMRPGDGRRHGDLLRAPGGKPIASRVPHERQSNVSSGPRRALVVPLNGFKCSEGGRIETVAATECRLECRALRRELLRSVHPTGMAVDLRKSHVPACLHWLRSTLLSLEKAGVLEATEEFSPPHFHVAVFPTAYSRYVELLTRADADGDG